MNIPGGTNMNVKTYAIFGGIMLLAVVLAMKLVKFEGTSTVTDVTKPAILSLKPVLSLTNKEA